MLILRRQLGSDNVRRDCGEKESPLAMQELTGGTPGLIDGKFNADYL